ncbi:MAG: hypothetical protein C0503_10205 [Gemmatimonas sp.]|nr:hypothetical protein [Gemmatimonas sp.]
MDGREFNSWTAFGIAEILEPPQAERCRAPSASLRARYIALVDLHTLPFVVVDVETTGGQPWGSDRVTEVAAVYVDGDRVEVAFESLINPGRPIPWHITRLTGISDAMVREAPRFEDIAGEFAAHLVGRVFVAHNASFDFGFLDAEFSRVAPTPLGTLVTGQLCTVRLARKLLSHLPRRNLDAVSAHYGVSISDRHRASGTRWRRRRCCAGSCATRRIAACTPGTTSIHCCRAAPRGGSVRLGRVRLTVLREHSLFARGRRRGLPCGT